MTKIMLVEDDKSLREIYGVRLLAEGYDIVSAGDGEEALAVAIKERPALIITDIMMPKISGFDMLDILRSTTETRNIKVIVMTALGSDEQRTRGDQFGVDRYLVKSQVGIEDVVRTVHEVLGDKPVSAPVIPPPPTPVTNPNPIQPAVPPVATPASTATSAPRSMATPPSLQPAATTSTPQPVKSQPPRQNSANPTALRNRVIQPLNDPNVSPVNINELLDRELAREAGVDLNNRPPIASTQEEKALVENQLNQFTPPNTQSALDVNEATNQTTNTDDDVAPTIQIDADGRVSMPQRPISTPPPPSPQAAVPPTPQLPSAPQTQSAPTPQPARSIPVQSVPSNQVQTSQPVLPPRPSTPIAAPRPPIQPQPVSQPPVQQPQLPPRPPQPPSSPPPPPPPVR